MALNRLPEPLDNVASRISMGRQLRCREIWGRQSHTSAAIDEDGDSAVGEHLQRLAAEHDRRNAAPPMGLHHDQIARLGIGDVDNRFVRMLVLDMHDLATYPRGGRMEGKTITPVTLALTVFARAVPYWIASSDKSEPSVGMRMWVCIIEIPRKNASTVQVRLP